MPDPRLRETLDALHRELERAEPIDPADRAALQRVAAELDEVLEREDEEAEPYSLLDQLSEATRRFEEDHPALTEAINRVAGALSNLGI